MRHTILPFFFFALEPTNQGIFDENTLLEILFSLAQITSDPQFNANDFINSQIPQKIVNICLKFGLENEGVYGLRVLGNLVAGEIEITQVNYK